MAFTYYIDPQVNCAFVRCFDEVKVGEGYASLKAITSDPQFVPNLNILRDTTETTVLETYGDTHELRKAREGTEKYTAKFKGTRFAWVVGSPADYAAAHRWSVTTRLESHVTRKPFREISQARQWLGIPEYYEIKYPSTD
jgi:hypothetical protein